MSGTLLAPLFNLGPQICGQVLGLPYQQYRPAGSAVYGHGTYGAAVYGPVMIGTPPIVYGNLVGNINAWITGDKGSRGRVPNTYGKPIWYGLFDTNLTLVGDYFVGPLGTFFIASQDVPMPMQLIECNQVITITRPGSGAPGATYYGGASPSTLQTLLTSWPASVIQGTKGERGEVNLPGDVRMAWVSILLPAVSGIEILPGDWITTNEATPMQYTVSSRELSSLGWRLSAASAVA